MKKGQVTVFIILGIVLVAVISIVAYVKNSTSNVKREEDILKSLPLDIAEIRKSLNECVEPLLSQAVVNIGNYGGYVIPLENSLATYEGYFTYGYYEGKRVLPSLEDTGKEISAFIETFMPYCVNFSEYDKLKVTAKEPVAKVNIFDGVVEVELDYPVIIEKNDKTFKLDQPYYAKVGVNLVKAHDVAEKIIDLVEKDPANINIDSLLTLNMDIDVAPYDEKTAIYSVKDEEHTLVSVDGVVPFYFIFATKAE